ncbi:MAG: ABC transporter substrate-binding protein [Oscillospiraceae bacterium]|nr:ABC transporter substrate-binding protein [Oscillospiraceae bacterium]
MKKILALTLALIMVLGMFAGCQPTTREKANEPLGADLTKEEKFAEHVTLTWCFPDGKQAADFSEWDRIVEAINEITEREINTTINIEVIPLGEYTEKMSMKFNANEKWDVCFTGAWNPYTTAVSMGVYEPLTQEYIDTYMPNTLATMNPLYKEAMTINGEIYGFPIEQIYVRQSGMRFETDWANEVGFDYTQVKELTDLEPYFDTLLSMGYTECFFSAGDDLMTNLVSYLGFDPLVDAMSPGVVEYRDETCTVINQYESEQFMELAKLMKKWYDKKYFTSGALTGEQDNPIFEEDRHPVDINPAYKPGGDAESSRSYGLEIKTIPFGDAVLTSSAIQMTAMAISVNCEYPGRAMAFIDLLNSNEELLNLVCWGEEDIDWVWVDKEQNLIEIQEGAYPGNHAFLVGNTFLTHYVDESQVGTWEETIAINSSADGSCILGFTFDASNVSGELANINAVLPEHLNSILCGMATGTVEDAVTAMNNALYQAGLQTVLDEMQRQVDAWKASK